MTPDILHTTAQAHGYVSINEDAKEWVVARAAMAEVRRVTLEEAARVVESQGRHWFRTEMGHHVGAAFQDAAGVVRALPALQPEEG